MPENCSIQVQNLGKTFTIQGKRNVHQLTVENSPHVDNNSLDSLDIKFIQQANSLIKNNDSFLSGYFKPQDTYITEKDENTSIIELDAEADKTAEKISDEVETPDARNYTQTSFQTQRLEGTQTSRNERISELGSSLLKKNEFSNDYSPIQGRKVQVYSKDASSTRLNPQQVPESKESSEVSIMRKLQSIIGPEKI